MTQPISIPGVTASSIDGELLWGFWYPALRSDELRGRALVTSTRLEVPLVLGRDAAGKAFALRDVCPHRAFPLSAGTCDGQTVECTYHGWRFDAHTGQCREVPSITADSKLQCDRIYAGSFPCEERDGYVWVYLANPEGRAVDRSAIPARPGTAEIQRALPHRASHRGSDLQHGHRHRRPDGPGAWSVRASIVVLAQPPQHPRKAKNIRADPAAAFA